MKPKWVRMYLDIAERFAMESHAVRLKVGAVFVSPDGAMSSGINGLPAGASNICEDTLEDGSLVTKIELSHAEEALFSKLMRQGVSTKGGIMFLTHSPCMNCAKIIVGSGVTSVYYRNEFRDMSGVEWMIKNGIGVHHAAL